MKILILETGKTVGINIYGFDEKLRTREFFLEYFLDAEGIYETTDEEKEKYGTDAEWTIETKQDFDSLAKVIEPLQTCIDGVREKYLENGETPESCRSDSGKYFVI